MDPPHSSGSHENDVGGFTPKKFIDCRSIAKIEFGLGARNDLEISLAFKTTHNSGTHHPAMACHEDAFAHCERSTLHGLLDGKLTLGHFHVGVHHDAGQFGKGDLRFPAKLILGLGWISY